jgi:adenylate cyclase class IV
MDPKIEIKDTVTRYEAKFYPVERDQIRTKLSGIGAKMVLPERKMRRSLLRQYQYTQLKCDYIRVRDEGQFTKISAIINPVEGGLISDRKQIDVLANSYEETIKLFQAMGFIFDTYQEMLREIWQLGNAEIKIDTWPGLLTFIEIHAGSEEEVKGIAEKLGFSWDKKIITSVTEIFMKVYHLTDKEVMHLLTNITFEKNPFGHQEQDNSWI